MDSRPHSSATDPFASHPNTPQTESAPLPQHSVPFAPGASQRPFATPRESQGYEARDSYPSASPLPSPGPHSSPLLGSGRGSPYRDEPAAPAAAPAGYAAPAALDEKSVNGNGRRHRRIWLCIALAIVAVVAIAIAVPIAVIKHKHNHSAAGQTGSSTAKNAAVTGGDGSTVTTANGTTFTYKNSFGGFWVDDPENPWNNSAQCNSWTKPLTEKWDFVNDKIYGVNLGGWFVLEPFITPAFYQKYNGSVDEWSLSVMMANDTSPGGGLDQIEQHYATFMDETDIARIAGAGLNWVRVPIPFWAIDVWNDEPFLAKKAWPYIVQLLKWCRKYGLRVNLDLHTIPGSQNGYNHSGRLGNIGWMYGIMGVANAQRSLDYIRTIAEFISQPEYVNIVQIFSPVNEALLGDIGIDSLSRFYYEMHNIIRSITGVGEGAWLAINDGFKGIDPWRDFLPGADRFIIDTHPYLAFGGVGAMSKPFSNGSTGHAAGMTYPLAACQGWGSSIPQYQSSFGVAIAGEFSNGWNDCGLFLHGVPTPGQADQQTFPGDCATWTAYEYWGDDVKDGLSNFALASMDALQNWFFWTWKIAPAQNGTILTPLWSYSLGLEGGWMPKDPRTANGTCSSYGYDIAYFNNSYQAYQTGGGDGVVSASAASKFGQWPPPTVSAFPATMPFSLAPTYTQVGPMSTLAVEYPSTVTFATHAPKKGVSSVPTPAGWANPSDTAARYTPVADCVYPDPWTIGPTTVACTGAVTATIGVPTGTVQAIMPPPTPAKVVAQP